MKRNLIIISILSVAAISIAVASKVWIYQNDNTRLGFDYDKLDSITYVTPGTIALSVSEKNVPFEGGTFDLDVVASQPWTVSISDPNSVKVSQFAGAGNATLKVTVAQNTNLSTRTTTIKFTLQDGTSNKLNVITAPWQDKIEVSVRKKNIGFEGGSFTIDVKSNISWTVSTNKTWVTLSKTKGEGNDNITVTVAPNSSATKDTAKVVYKTKNVVWSNTFIYRDVENISVSPSSQDVSYLGGEVPINITSNTSWTISSDKDWVTFSETQGSGNKTITATVAPNTTKAKDVATITITTKYAKIQATTKINRDVETISVSPSSQDISCLGGEVSISVTSNTSWTISSDKDFVTFSETQGSGNKTITATVSPNITKAKDVVTITVTTKYAKIPKYTKINRDVENISVTPTSLYTSCIVGKIESVNITSNTLWTASSNKSWATLSKISGTGNASVVITVASEVKTKTDTAIITFTTSSGKSATITIYRTGYTGAGDNVTDINGRSYPTVWIGGQNWMAENLMCDKYDTQSEAYKEGRYTVKTSIGVVSTPYYTDASDKSKWNSSSEKYGVNLTDEQVAKLGYLYNWAAAVGVADGEKQKTDFTGNRQGICPNGWHIPSRAEWQTLYDYIYSAQKLSSNTVGKHLKTTSGWYDHGEPGKYPQGLDTYGFAALPAGSAGHPDEGSVSVNGSSVNYVGYKTDFKTATPETHAINAFHYRLYYSSDNFYDRFDSKVLAESVRCIKD